MRSIAEPTSMEGTIRFVTSSNVRDVEIENAAQKARNMMGKEAAGIPGISLSLEKRMEEGVTYEVMGLMWPEGTHLLRPSYRAPREADGSERSHSFRSQYGWPDRAAVVTPYRKGQNPTVKLDDAAKVSFRIATECREHTVTFRFTNLPLPSNASKPRR